MADFTCPWSKPLTSFHGGGYDDSQHTPQALADRRACRCPDEGCQPAHCTFCAHKIAQSDPEVLAAQARLAEIEVMEDAATLELGRALKRATEKARVS